MTKPSAAQQALADETVRIMYRSFDNDSLAEILRIGEEYESKSDRLEVVAMNMALRAEIERRKAEAMS